MIKYYNIITYYLLLIAVILALNCQYGYAQGYQSAQVEYFYKQMKNNDIKKVECYSYYSETDTAEHFITSIMRYKKEANILEYVSYWSSDSSLLYFNSDDLLTERTIYWGDHKIIYELKYEANNKILSEIGVQNGKIVTTTKYNYTQDYNIRTAITYDSDNNPFSIDTVWYDKKGRIESDVTYGRENKFETRFFYFYNKNDQLIKIKTDNYNIDFQYNSNDLKLSETWNPTGNGSWPKYYKFIYKYYF